MKRFKPQNDRSDTNIRREGLHHSNAIQGAPSNVSMSITDTINIQGVNERRQDSAVEELLHNNKILNPAS
jgi:hypothetical protein